MSAKRCTSSGERRAARPMLSGQSENMLDRADAAGLSTNPWRGSVEKVIGIPRPEQQRELLRGVDPPGELARVVRVADHVQVREPVVDRERRQRRQPEHRVRLVHGTDRDDRQEHRPGLVLEGHPADEVLRSGRGGQRRVLIREARVCDGHGDSFQRGVRSAHAADAEDEGASDSRDEAGEDEPHACSPRRTGSDRSG